MKVEDLDVITEFKSLPITTKKWILNNSKLIEYEAGDEAFKKGDAVESMRMVLEGGFSIKVPQKDGWREIGTFEKGTITGLLPYSRMQEAGGTAVATKTSRVLELHKKHFSVLKTEHLELIEVLVHKMTTRVREFTKSQQQNEKLMALGKLSAGLAHELNNPASAIVRSSKLLKKHLGTVPDKFMRVMEIEADQRQVEFVNELIFSKIKSPKPRLSLLDKTNLEDEMIDLLESNGIEDGSEDASMLVEFGFTKEDIEALIQKIRSKDFTAVLGWIIQVLTTESMVDEIESASSRISDLIDSVKSYTHMDRSQETEKIDPVKGIEDTLKILNHKSKKKAVEINIEAEEHLPAIDLHPSEINQVWMNLLDNAIDALNESGGKINISLIKDGDFLKVNIVDNGAGIKDEDINNIFDPFFTTKKIGEGTGLGLDVVNRVVEKHKGKISVKSKPGETNFEICIPYSIDL